jgi:hypothetical protein
MTVNPPVGWIHGHKEDGTVCFDIIISSIVSRCSCCCYSIFTPENEIVICYRAISRICLDSSFGGTLDETMAPNATKETLLHPSTTLYVNQASRVSTRPAMWGDIERVEN